MKKYKVTFENGSERITFFIRTTPSTDTLALVIAWNRLVARYGETYARRVTWGVRLNRIVGKNKYI